MPPERVGVEPSPKRVRVQVAGETIVDTVDAMLLWTGQAVPVYAFEPAALRVDRFEVTGQEQTTVGRIEHLALETPTGRLEGAAWRLADPADVVADAAGAIVLVWDAMDRWFVEDEPAYGHPRDPYHRIDVHESSRHVVVEHAGHTLADSSRPRLLFETGLPPRFYLLKLDVAMDRLEPSSTVTRCAYKGTTEHYHAHLDGGRVEDVAWCYPHPNPEHGKIQDLVCFYQERIDRVTVDGVAEAPVQTPWS